jgi:Type I restriction modification DNA specificity domain
VEIVTSADFNIDDFVSTLTYAPMLITDIFKVHNGSGAEKKSAGAVPYVAASFRNNGIVGYVESAKYPGGWLSLVKDGDGGAGQCFYQPTPFWPSNHVVALEPKNDGLSASALLCIAALITHQCFPKYSRGNAINEDRLSRQKIMVPVVTDSEGNYLIDLCGLSKLGENLLATVKRLAVSVRTVPFQSGVKLTHLSFQPMLITSVFESIKASSAWYDKNKIKAGPGQFSYISRSGLLNGYDSSVGLQDKPPNAGNAITIGVDTNTVFYQPAPFYTSVKIQVLRHPQLSEENGNILSMGQRGFLRKAQGGPHYGSSGD